MNKQEFESMAMRNDAKIGVLMYESIERMYMNTNAYAKAHHVIDETKQAFVKRVFGGKVNTPKTIAQKIANESIKENRWLLMGHDKARLDEMDELIIDHYNGLLKYNM